MLRTCGAYEKDNALKNLKVILEWLEENYDNLTMKQIRRKNLKVILEWLEENYDNLTMKQIRRLMEIEASFWEVVDRRRK
jgi:hypothetical protein